MGANRTLIALLGSGTLVGMASSMEAGNSKDSIVGSIGP